MAAEEGERATHERPPTGGVTEGVAEGVAEVGVGTGGEGQGC